MKLQTTRLGLEETTGGYRSERRQVTTVTDPKRQQPLVKTATNIGDNYMHWLMRITYNSMLFNKQNGNVKGIWKILNTIINKSNEPDYFVSNFIYFNRSVIFFKVIMITFKGNRNRLHSFSKKSYSYTFNVIVIAYIFVLQSLHPFLA